MALHITQIGKHKFVSGLFWQALSRPRDFIKEARDLARKVDCDLMVLRIDHTAAQAGFAHTRDGARKGLYSLAAVISKALAVEGAYYDGDRQPLHNWLGAFRLDDGYWVYFAVRDASFLPNGDFAGTREEVLERLQSDYGLGGWNAVVGEEELAEYGFHNFNARSLDSLITRKRDGRIRTYKWWGLRPVDNKQSWRLVAACAAVAALAIASLAYWQRYQRDLEEKRRELAIEAAQRELMGKAPPSDLPAPWVNKPLPSEMVAACVDKLRYLTPGGWELESFECSPDQAVHTWTRRRSSVALLLEQVPQAQIEAGGDKARFAEPIAPSKRADEALLELRQLLPQVLSAVQLMQLTFTIVPLPPPPLPQGASNMAPPYWKGYAITMRSGGLPMLDAGAILSRPGLRIEKLVHKSGEWLIEGVMYAK